MTLTTDRKADLAFKKLYSSSFSSELKSPFTELTRKHNRKPIPRNILTSETVPFTLGASGFSITSESYDQADGTTSGTNNSLTLRKNNMNAVLGSNTVFEQADLDSVIDENYDTSYKIFVRQNNGVGNAISQEKYQWHVDPYSQTLTFLNEPPEGIDASNPPYIEFVFYSGPLDITVPGGGSGILDNTKYSIIHSSFGGTVPDSNFYLIDFDMSSVNIAKTFDVKINVYMDRASNINSEVILLGGLIQDNGIWRFTGADYRLHGGAITVYNVDVTRPTGGSIPSTTSRFAIQNNNGSAVSMTTITNIVEILGTSDVNNIGVNFSTSVNSS